MDNDRMRSYTETDYQSLMGSITFNKPNQAESTIETQFSLDEMQKDKTEMSNLKNQEDGDIINQNESIFSRLADEAQMKNGIAQSCGVCQKSFSVMVSRKQCRFCGISVCKEHSKKLRADPQNQQNFERVCDICDDKYIRYEVQLGFIQKREVLLNESQILEAQAQEIIQTVSQRQNRLTQIKLDHNRATGELKTQQNEQLFKIANINSTLQQLKQQEQQLMEQISRTAIETNEIRNKIASRQGNQEQKSKQERDIMDQINKLDHEIKEMKREIEKVKSQKLKEKQQRQSEQSDQQIILEPKIEQEAQIFSQSQSIDQPIQKEKSYCSIF